MDKKQFEEYLEEQKRLGHPNFKNKIVETLVSVFNIEPEIAIKTVFDSTIEKRIDEDMNWSQHMGADFWAKEIIENNLLYKK